MIGLIGFCIGIGLVWDFFGLHMTLLSLVPWVFGFGFTAAFIGRIKRGILPEFLDEREDETTILASVIWPATWLFLIGWLFAQMITPKGDRS